MCGCSSHLPGLAVRKNWYNFKFPRSPLFTFSCPITVNSSMHAICDFFPRQRWVASFFLGQCVSQYYYMDGEQTCPSHFIQTLSACELCLSTWTLLTILTMSNTLANIVRLKMHNGCLWFIQENAINPLLLDSSLPTLWSLCSLWVGVWSYIWISSGHARSSWIIR